MIIKNFKLAVLKLVKDKELFLHDYKNNNFELNYVFIDYNYKIEIRNLFKYFLNINSLKHK